MATWEERPARASYEAGLKQDPNVRLMEELARCEAGPTRSRPRPRARRVFRTMLVSPSRCGGSV